MKTKLLFILFFFTGKPWDVVDYGVCEIEDILSDVSENTVVVTSFNEDDKMIAIPKREQTPEEIERTKQFATEVSLVYDLLSNFLIINFAQLTFTYYFLGDRASPSCSAVSNVVQ